MKSERKEALLAIKENIEMKLFSSEERCTVIQTQEEKKDNTFDQVSENFPGRKNESIPGLFHCCIHKHRVIQETFIHGFTNWKISHSRRMIYKKNWNIKYSIKY